MLVKQEMINIQSSFLKFISEPFNIEIGFLKSLRVAIVDEMPFFVEHSVFNFVVDVSITSTVQVSVAICCNIVKGLVFEESKISISQKCEILVDSFR